MRANGTFETGAVLQPPYLIECNVCGHSRRVSQRVPFVVYKTRRRTQRGWDRSSTHRILRWPINRSWPELSSRYASIKIGDIECHYRIAKELISNVELIAEDTRLRCVYQYRASRQYIERGDLQVFVVVIKQFVVNAQTIVEKAVLLPTEYATSVSGANESAEELCGIRLKPPWL